MPYVLGIFNPAEGGFNLGDEIILDAITNLLRELEPNAYLATMALHQPLADKQRNKLKDAHRLIVAGTNMLDGRYKLRGNNRWPVTFYDARKLPKTILVGAGWTSYRSQPNLIGKLLYSRILDKSALHALRDNHTVKMMQRCGIDNVINTSCPSLWNLTPEKLTEIPLQKGDDVIFTLTDYSKSPENDRFLIQILRENYKKIYFWPQGAWDLKYLNNLGYSNDIEVIPSTLPDYDHFLSYHRSLDYIGTRLHGGLRALQHKKRTVIVSIDNRAVEISRDIRLPAIDRLAVRKDLTQMLQQPIHYDLDIPYENIAAWKQNFSRTMQY